MKADFMLEALVEANQALENQEFPVGCVIVAGEKILARGQRANSLSGNELDHAEIVALRELRKNYPDRLNEELVAYSTMEPCLMCFSALLLNNVHTIVYGYEDIMGGGTNIPLTELKPLYAHKKVHIVPGVMREECLKLFKRYFSEDTSGYWKDSLLAHYTLEQNTGDK